MSYNCYLQGPVNGETESPSMVTSSAVVQSVQQESFQVCGFIKIITVVSSQGNLNTVSTIMSSFKTNALLCTYVPVSCWVFGDLNRSIGSLHNFHI